MIWMISSIFIQVSIDSLITYNLLNPMENDYSRDDTLL